MLGLQLDKRDYNLSVQTLNKAILLPAVSFEAPSTSYDGFIIQTYKWLSDYNISEQDVIDPATQLYVYERVVIPNGNQTLNPFALANLIEASSPYFASSPFDNAQPPMPELDQLYIPSLRYDDSLPHFNNTLQRIPIEFDLILPCSIHETLNQSLLSVVVPPQLSVSPGLCGTGQG